MARARLHFRHGVTALGLSLALAAMACISVAPVSATPAAAAPGFGTTGGDGPARVVDVAESQTTESPTAVSSTDVSPTAASSTDVSPTAASSTDVSPTAVARPGMAIDNSSRDSVRSAFLTWHQAEVATPVGWTGNAETCRAGTESAASKAATESMVNYFREMADLDPITLDPALSAKAQKAALIMTANNQLSHNPPDSWKCWSEEGYEAASKSNLYLGRSGAASIDGYIRDPGASNTAVGHRRWILYPRSKTMGSGSTSNANALYVIGGMTTNAPSPVVAWPTAGYFPAQLQPNGRWSVSIPGADPSNATVTVTAPSGDQMHVTMNSYAHGYGDDTLVWEVDGIPTTGGHPDAKYHVQVSGLQGSGSSTYSYDVTIFDAEAAVAPVVGKFVPLKPVRLFDTRANGGARLAPSQRLDVPVLGQAGIPSTDVTAVVLNVTVADTNGSGYVTVWPAGSPRPLASNLNFDPNNRVVANQVTVPVGTGGKVSLLATESSHLLADVAGYYLKTTATKSGRFVSVNPYRMFDTRTSTALGSGTTRDFKVTGLGGVPGSGVSAVVLNVTATMTASPGYLTVWPAGTPRPLASSLNITRANQTLSNQVTVPVSADGRISVYGITGTHVVGDIAGYFTDNSGWASTSGLFVARTPVRLFDSRTTPTNLRWAGASWNVQVTGNVGIKEEQVSSVLVNLTGTRAVNAGYLTVWPYGSHEPYTSLLNLEWTNHTRANAATLNMGDYGLVSLKTSGGMDVVIDVLGQYTK